MSLSLEDLMDIRVSTGSLSDSTAATSSSAITIIRQEQIELSAAKNLAVLLEQHVPGLMLMEHSEGNKIGHKICHQQYTQNQHFTDGQPNLWQFRAECSVSI